MKSSLILNIYYILHFDKPFDVILENWVYGEYKRASLDEALSLDSRFNKEVVKRAMKG